MKSELAELAGTTILPSEASRDVSSNIDHPVNGAINLSASLADIFELSIAQRFKAGNRHFATARGMVGVPCLLQVTHRLSKKLAGSVLVGCCRPRDSAHDLRSLFLVVEAHRVCGPSGPDQPRLGIVWESAGGTGRPHEMEDILAATYAGGRYFSTGSGSAALAPCANHGAGGDY